MSEQWFDIPRWSAYEVSSLGRVRALRRLSPNGRLLPERILKVNVDARGRKRVDLAQNGKRITTFVHTLQKQATQ